MAHAYIAQLFVLYEDLRIELYGITENDLSKLGSTDQKYRKHYFVRWSYAPPIRRLWCWVVWLVSGAAYQRRYPRHSFPASVNERRMMMPRASAKRWIAACWFSVEDC
jgi:hypothetical protein